jgi:hypothetical protein
MTKYYMRPDSNTPPAYSYCEGDETDSLWNAETCIEVPKQPTYNHVYNMTSEAWELSETYYMTDLRAKRDAELTRTDKYVLSDYPISAEDKTIVETYRTALRDCPNAELLADRVLPTCPEICK